MQLINPMVFRQGMLLQKVFLQLRVRLVLVWVRRGGKTQLDHCLAEGKICFARNLDSMCANHLAVLSTQTSSRVMFTLLAIKCGCVAACS